MNKKVLKTFLIIEAVLTVILLFILHNSPAKDIEGYPTINYWVIYIATLMFLVLILAVSYMIYEASKSALNPKKKVRSKKR